MSNKIPKPGDLIKITAPLMFFNEIVMVIKCEATPAITTGSLRCVFLHKGKFVDAFVDSIFDSWKKVS